MRHISLLIYIAVACVLGGIVGSLLTVSVFAPLYVQAGNPTVTEKIYINRIISLQDRVTGILGDNKESVVHIKVVKLVQTTFGLLKSESSGSGFVVSEDGYVVTNEHVISDASNITVVLQNGDEFDAKLRGGEPLNDVAVIKISPPYGLDPVEVGDSDELKAGEFVVAMGSPYRLQNTVTLGIISALDRTLTSEGGFRIEKVIQTDAPINPGNSGGPLFGMDGKVIGVNTAIISTSGGSEGIGFSIPINTVNEIYTELIESGKISRPWLGIAGTDVTVDMVNVWDLEVEYGVLVIDFTVTSPAREAGLRETFSRPGRSDFILGDIIVSIGGGKITNNADLLNILLQYEPGDTAEVEVYRDGIFREFAVELGERPEGL